MNIAQFELITKVCRLCLKPSNCCIHLDGKWGEAMKLRIVINSLLPFEIDAHDNHSRYICWNCCMHIQLLNTFVEKCVKKNETLKGVAGSSTSHLSQSSHTSETDSGSVDMTELQPDWLSLSFNSEVDSAISTSGLQTEMQENVISQSTGKKDVIQAGAGIKRKYSKTKNKSFHNKENRHNKTTTMRRRRGNTACTAPCKLNTSATTTYKLNNNTECNRRSRRPSKSTRASMRQDMSRRPPLIFSQKATCEDVQSSKSGSEFNFSLDIEDSPDNKKSSSDKEKDKMLDTGVLRSSRTIYAADDDLQSFLNCSSLEPPITCTADNVASGKRKKSDDNFDKLLTSRNLVKDQPNYFPEGDLSTQFARKYLSFVSQ